MYLLNRKEMMNFDKKTIENYGISPLILMENAGKGCADFIVNEEGEAGAVVIFCGTGNNGGDGFVVARWLYNYGMDVKILILGDLTKMSAETMQNYQICNKMNIEIYSVTLPRQLEDFKIVVEEADLIVDAIFGIGFSGEMKLLQSNAVDLINSTHTRVYSIDIPSGINADTGYSEKSVKADYTMAIAAAKYGHFIGKGKSRIGEVAVIDISIPDDLLEMSPKEAYLVDETIAKYPQRNPVSHKGDFGRVAIIAGSPGLTGAAILSCRAALRSGAGLITLFHEDNQLLNQVYESQLTEVMTFPFDYNATANNQESGFWRKLNSQDVLLIGPGIGKDDKVKKMLESILKKWEKPLILDADALNIIAEDEKLMRYLKSSDCLLTPHLGEFSRLTGIEIEEIERNPIELLKKFVKENDVKVLLKSSTRIFCRRNEIFIDISGNDGLATGGSGDVLSGIIASFVAQKMNLAESAVSASYLLGTTSEKLAEKRFTPSITPSDIIDSIFLKNENNSNH
ncbi:MAG: NAD(P)H-hydrate dehydratase [Candidatus Cloacimonetes bacterium]|nr:NAD(P)H-hydrate dehydratase [Candidatus Cloacimonadota bacterium]